MDHLRNTEVLQLRVKVLTGEVHSFSVPANQTIWNFKIKLSQIFGVSPYQQKLACQNNTQIDLQDATLFSQYKLRSGDTILLIVKNEESFPVFLKNARGTTSVYDVLPSDTVAVFKTRVQQREGVPEEKFWLASGGRRLQNNCKLSDYNIGPYGTIHLHICLRGGEEPVVGSA